MIRLKYSWGRLSFKLAPVYLRLKRAGERKGPKHALFELATAHLIA